MVHANVRLVDVHGRNLAVGERMQGSFLHGAVQPAPRRTALPSTRCWIAPPCSRECLLAR